MIPYYLLKMLNLLKLSKRGIATQLRPFSEATQSQKPNLEHSILDQRKNKLWEIQNRTGLQFTLTE